jgi:hypothetical protein
VQGVGGGRDAGHACAGVDAVADAVDERANAVVVQMALAGAVDGGLLVVHKGVEAQLCQRQHAQRVQLLRQQHHVARRHLQRAQVARGQQAACGVIHRLLGGRGVTHLLQLGAAAAQYLDKYLHRRKFPFLCCVHPPHPPPLPNQ